MSFEYQGFASLGVNLNRQKYGPLDISNVFTSAADLKYYLTKGTFTEGVSEYWYKDDVNKIVPYPYEGQVLATAIDGTVNVYVLALDAEGNFVTQEIGSSIETDDKTLTVNAEGKLELVGLPAEVTGKTFVPSLVNGVLTWAEPDTTTAEGQQQAIEGLNTRVTEVEELINGKAASGEEGAEDYVPAVKGIVEQLADEKTRAEAAEAELSDRIDAIDFVDPAELEEALKSYATIQYVIDKHKELTTIIGQLNHFTAKVVTSIDEVTATGVLYLIKDETVTGVDQYNEYIVIDGKPVLIGDTSIDLSDYYSKTEIDTKVDTITDAINTETEAREALAEAVESLETDLSSYALASDVETELAKKANAESVYTKDEVDAKIGVPGTPAQGEEGTEDYVAAAPGTGVYQHVYSKDEVTALIADITGGESAADVLAALNAYKTTNDTRVKNVEDLNAEQAIAIEAAQTQADKGVSDAAQVATDLAVLNARVGSNTNEIAVVKENVVNMHTTLSNKITGIEGVISAQAESLASHDNKITALEESVATNTAAISTINGQVTALSAEDTRLAELISGLDTDKANAADVYTKTEANEAIAAAINAIPSVDLEPYAKTEDVNATVELINAEVAKKANASDVYTKTEADAEFMTQDEVDARISALIDAANSEDAIKNINDLVTYVNDNASDIAQLISGVADNKAAHETNAAAIAAITGQIAANEVKESTEISVTTVEGEDATGVQLGIKEVNVNKLVQTPGDTLVISGGSAN